MRSYHQASNDKVLKHISLICVSIVLLLCDIPLYRPSEDEENGNEKDPLLNVGKWYHKNWVKVYEEGYGASDGFAKNYW